MTRIIGVVFLVVTAITLPAAIADDAASLKGSFATKLGSSDVLLSFDGKGKFIMVMAKKELVAGTYKIAKDQVELTDERGELAAKGDSQTGQYTWTLKEGKLTFKKLADKSEGREKALTGSAWIATKPDQDEKPTAESIGLQKINAYQDLGATYGSFSTNGESSAFGHQEPTAKLKMPGFYFQKMPKGKFPDVDVRYDLGFKSISDTEMKNLAGLKNLSGLYVWRTAISDAGLKELTALKNLSTLVLSGTKVTDDGLKELAELENLTTLVLKETQVTNAGLKHLIGLKNLTVLGLANTKVTDEGVMDLSKALPKCKIFR